MVAASTTAASGRRLLRHSSTAATIASTAIPGVSASTLTPFITNVTGAARWSTNHAHTSRSGEPGRAEVGDVVDHRRLRDEQHRTWRPRRRAPVCAPRSGTSLPSAVRRVASTTVANSAHTAATDQAILSPMSANHMCTS